MCCSLPSLPSLPPERLTRPPSVRRYITCTLGTIPILIQHCLTHAGQQTTWDLGSKRICYIIYYQNFCILSEINIFIVSLNEEFKVGHSVILYFNVCRNTFFAPFIMCLTSSQWRCLGWDDVINLLQAEGSISTQTTTCNLVVTGSPGEMQQ